MKKNLHPKDYRFVVFKDVSCDYSFLTRSTIHTKETTTWEDGKEYPLYKMDISNKSHPYFTGQQNLVDTAGRIEKFNQKYNLKESVVRDVPAADEVVAVEPSKEENTDAQDS